MYCPSPSFSESLVSVSLNENEEPSILEDITKLHII